MSWRQSFLLLCLLLPAGLLLSLATGPAVLSLPAALGDWLSGADSISRLILMEVRLPRTLLAITVGAALGLSGAALQGMLRNPLASPDLLGVSQTASLLAVITLYFGFAAQASLLLPAAAMCGALLAVLLIFMLAGRLPGSLSLILVGIAINALMSALIALSLNLAPNAYALQEIYFWLLGSVTNRTLEDLAFAIIPIAAGTLLILSTRPWLDALSLGEDTAVSLGFNRRAQAWTLIVGVSLCTGASVAVAGNIGFVGLLVPHLLRPLAGHSPSRLLAASMLGGALLLLAADILVRFIPGTRELQLGVLTSALGGPFFLWLVLRQRRQVLS